MSSLVAGLTSLKKAKTFFEDFKRQIKGGVGDKIVDKYISKIDWCLLDFKTCIHFTDEIRASIEKEISSDEFQIDAIYEKILLIDKDKRELIETVIDGMLNGEQIVIVPNETITPN